MDITKLTPATLRELANLSEAKEKLSKQIAEIDAKLTRIAGGEALPKAAAKRKVSAKAAATEAPKAPKKKEARGRRGDLKGSIIKLLQSAGPQGLAVKEICKALNKKNQNIHVWFSTTGKNVPQITRHDDGRFAFIEGKTSTAAPAPVHTPAPAPTPAPVPVAAAPAPTPTAFVAPEPIPAQQAEF